MGKICRVEMQDGIDLDDIEVIDRLMNVKGVYSVAVVDAPDPRQGRLFGDVETLCGDVPILPQPVRCES